MSCNIEDCVRDIVEGNPEFCQKHAMARQNLEKTFKKWQIAYGKSYSMDQYLERLANDETISAGEWVVDVAQHLLEKK